MHRRFAAPLILLLLIACGPKTTVQPSAPQAQSIAPLLYTIDVTERADDHFRVTLVVDDLGPENDIFQFAMTAPGTYQTMNIGKLVRHFKARDEAGRDIPVEQSTTNRLLISDPERVATITYEIQETWDKVGGEFIYPMAGTSIEDDHVQICPHAVLGFPGGMQERPLELTLRMPDHWQVGTALEKTGDSVWIADSYDHAVDSPLLAGELSYATSMFKDTQVDIYTYSKSGGIDSADMMDEILVLFDAMEDFVGYIPIDRYTFLYHFEDRSMGAWEHNRSSNYVYAERDFHPDMPAAQQRVAAHEIFHIVHPLHIHSDLITPFNFENPKPSKHLWLYEGSTEWAAHMLRLRAGLEDLETHLSTLQRKLMTNGFFNPSYSLVDMSTKSYGEGASQFANIYMRGAVTISLLDIKLLQLSNGTRGWREVLQDLLAKYEGPDTSFPEDEFFDIVVAKTDPSIAAFIENYIKGAETLPVAETFEALGITYRDKLPNNTPIARLGMTLQPLATGATVIGQVSKELYDLGVREGDQVIAFDNKPIKHDFRMTDLQPLFEMGVGDTYQLTVKRGEETHNLVLQVLALTGPRRHIFTIDPNPTPEQAKLRDAWMRNL